MPNLRGVTAGAAIVGVGYATWLLNGWGGDTVIRTLGDVGLIFFAAFAALCAALAASRAHGKNRAAWVSLAAGAGAWAAGEAVWSYYDLVAGVRPFPSWADAGYLAFLVGAGLCLGFLLLTHPRGIQLRLALDGLIVGAAVFGAVWVTLLDPVAAARAASPSRLALALSYPEVATVFWCGLFLELGGQLVACPIL